MKEQNRENELERMLKSKAEGYERMPSESVWQSIESAVQGRRRKGIIWWSAAALLMIAVGTGSYFLMSNQSTNTSDAVTVSREDVMPKQQPARIPEAESSADEPSASSNEKELAEESSVLASGEKQMTSAEKDQIALSHSGGSANLHEDATGREEFSFLITGEEALMLEASSVSSQVAERSFMSHSSPLVLDQLMARRFTIEADGMPVGSYSWTQQEVSGAATAFQVPSVMSSFWTTEGFSIGGNFLFNASPIWFAGAGVHYTATGSQMAFAEQTILTFDTTEVIFDNTTYTSVDTSYYIYEPILHMRQQWLEFTMMAGAYLFHGSGNHLRIAGGAGYSRLLASEEEMQNTPTSFALENSVTGAGTTSGNSIAIPSTEYEMNQFQLFSEVAYVRDIGSHFGITAGGRVTYLPFNLLKSEVISHHLFWVGLKAGVQYSF